MNWSAKLFLSVACCIGTVVMFFWMLLTAPYGLPWKAITTAVLPVIGFILALLALKFDEQDRTIAKASAIGNALLILGIAWLYYDFVTSFSLNLNFRIH